MRSIVALLCIFLCIPRLIGMNSAVNDKPLLQPTSIDLLANKKLKSSLIIATKRNSVVVMEKLLQAGVSVETKDIFGRRLFHWAAQKGHVAAIKILLNHNADIEASWGVLGLHPFHLAASSGQVDCLISLLELGADLEAHTSCGWTPLNCAVRYGRDNCVKALLTMGADINARDCAGMTPLDTVIQSPMGTISCLKMLITYGAQINRRSDNGYTPLYRAMKAEKLEFITLLLDQGAHNTSEKDDGKMASGLVSDATCRAPLKGHSSDEAFS